MLKTELNQQTKKSSRRKSKTDKNKNHEEENKKPYRQIQENEKFREKKMDQLEEIHELNK